MILNMQLIAALGTLLLGAAYTWATAKLPDAMIGDPHAPKVYPFIIGVAMILFGVVLLFQELRRQRAGKAEKALTGKVSEEGRLVAFVAAACVLYALLFVPLGYIISTFLFIEGIMLFISKGKKMLSPTLWAAGFSIGVYILFSKILSLTLPATPFIGF